MSDLQDFPRITPFLWFDANAEEAVEFYLSIFKNSRRLGEFRTPDKSGGPHGKILTMSFELDGQKFTALNGGPTFKFNEAISFVVRCDSQQEVDEYWSKLSAGGREIECGWLKDKFGLSWQVVPTALRELLSDPDPEKSGRVLKAMLQMKKIDIAALRDASEQASPESAR